ncbi:TetR/AcrR family transcriptional regulator [Oceanispirochaeta sp.]|uniref:TetR/AcrR family transcriptional regulator n=1 Tax=Oceanispirochaeta sp. TaxID=2035350 RepID=UPI002618EB6F|nr:TetR/AcrR family transcriptional regulator [Oceanispirochaeta sp.]MDA3958989.1 TetR/AcrR family transcriptional regulator [Oceanispirochaeta sp.]
MNSTNKKEQIEIQALIFFARNDYEGSSLNDIAKALNVTKGAIYHYFDGKADLFKSSILRFLDTMDYMLNGTLPRDIPFKVLLENLFKMEEMVAEIGRETGMGEIMENYESFLYLYIAGVKKFPELRIRMEKLYYGFRSNLVNLMNAAIVKGEIQKDTDTEAVAFEITAFYEGALLLGALSNQKDYIELGPRVCSLIWERIAEKGRPENPNEYIQEKANE